MKILLTGDRPSGPLHLGHYVGSLQNRVKMQKDFKSYILIADIQALTDNYENPKLVKENVMEVLADYLAVGIDPNITSICLQSNLTGLFELTQYFSNLISFNYLKHNPTLKTELAQKRIDNMGFLMYPISQAADILAFKADVVPVGEDQSPILELTNKVVKKFNSFYGKTFEEIEGVYSPCPRLSGIHGKNKMSKSLNNAIFLKDTNDQIKKKVNKMFTDPLHLRVEDPGHLEGNVVVEFLDIFDTNKTELDELKQQYQKGGIADGFLKNRLTDCLVSLIEPIREKREGLIKNKQELIKTLEKGTEEANEKIEKTMKEVRDIFQAI